MSRYQLTAQAGADLRDIARYTEETWGAVQTERYGEELELALQQLSLAPIVGRKREAIKPGLRSYPVARHLAFYIQQKDRIIILRILHPRMNVDEAFKSG
jgi:toxin ParE1/3/4